MVLTGRRQDSFCLTYATMALKLDQRASKSGIVVQTGVPKVEEYKLVPKIRAFTATADVSRISNGDQHSPQQ